MRKSSLIAPGVAVLLGALMSTAMIPPISAQEFSGVTPRSLDLTLAPGESTREVVKLTIDSACFRAILLDLRASDPEAVIENLSGQILNGCSGDTSTFDVVFTGGAGPLEFDLQFVDAEFGGVVALIPVTITPPPGTDDTFEVNPARLALTLGPGETTTENLELTIIPDCIRSFVLDLRSSKPAAVIENLSGVQVNGCGGDTSRFKVAFTGTGDPMPLQFYLLFVDEFSGAIASIPVTIYAPPGSDIFKVNPPSLDLALAPGETSTEVVEATLHAICVRPYELEVRASNSAALVENLSGVQGNSCGGDTSTFRVAFTGAAEPSQFHLVFVDVFHRSPGDRAAPPVASIPVTITPPSTAFIRGDCNDDGAVDISDAISTLGVLFLGQDEITCQDACDSNDDSAVDISDAIATLGVLFLGNGIIPLPGRTQCGVDPTEDELGCDTFERCP